VPTPCRYSPITSIDRFRIAFVAEAQIVGEIEPERVGLVQFQTAFGSSRVVGMPAGDPLPRIC